MPAIVFDNQINSIIETVIALAAEIRNNHNIRTMPENIRSQGPIPLNRHYAIMKCKHEGEVFKAQIQFSGEASPTFIEVDTIIFCEDLDNQEFDFNIIKVMKIFDVFLMAHNRRLSDHVY